MNKHIKITVDERLLPGAIMTKYDGGLTFCGSIDSLLLEQHIHDEYIVSPADKNKIIELLRKGV